MTHQALPWQGHSDTSREAAQAGAANATIVRARVRDFFQEKGEYGATCDEAEAKLGIIHQSCSARVRELVLAGDIADLGDRRLTRSNRRARVYVHKDFIPEQPK